MGLACCGSMAASTPLALASHCTTLSTTTPYLIPPKPNPPAHRLPRQHRGRNTRLQAGNHQVDFIKAHIATSAQRMHDLQGRKKAVVRWPMSNCV